MRTLCIGYLVFLLSFPTSPTLLGQVDESSGNPVLATSHDDVVPRLGQLSISKLEQRLQEINIQLKDLSKFSFRSGAESVVSSARTVEKRTEWFQVDWDLPASVDQVVLVPVIWRHTKTGLQADGFPVDFRVIVGSKSDPSGTVIASYTEKDRLLPRLAPLVVPCPSISATWVRIEASRLSPRFRDSRYVLQLSEILVFSDKKNVALNQTVSLSSEPEGSGANQSRFLVDGFVPHLMDSSQGVQSIAFKHKYNTKKNAELMIDLGEQHQLSGAHLHTVDLSDSIPQSYKVGYGVPKNLLVEGANRSDFSDAISLFRFQPKSFHEFGPIIMRRFPEATCRYVRLTAVVPDTAIRNDTRFARIGFAEIELFSDGVNVAYQKPVSSSFVRDNQVRPISALTDGRNYYGKILPIRDWLNELSRRHELESERPLVIHEQKRRYATQGNQLSRTKWLAALLAVGIGLTFIVNRVVRVRQLAHMRNRFAADLHDELGANLHVIGLLSDLAQTALDSPEKHNAIHQRIRAMTQRSGDAVRYCTNMLEAKTLYGDLLEDMHRATQRIMADIEGELSFTGDENILRGLKPRTRADIFLFYKESLVNISRHSEATQFFAELSLDAKELCLSVKDNGQGYTDPLVNSVPASLMRRARLLGAKVTSQHSEHEGAHIILKMKLKRSGFSA